MPTYQYACRDCGDELEVVQSFTDEPLTECPTCQGSLRKVFSPVGIAFKGSGFYKTDSRGSSSSTSGNGASKDSSGDSSSSDSSSSDSSSGSSKKEPSTSSSGNGSSTASSGSSGSGSSSTSAAKTA